MERRGPTTRRRLFFTVLCFLSIASTLASPERHLDFFTTDPYVQVSSFMDEDSLGGCSDNLLAADANDDKRISSDEFAMFVGSRSQGQLSGLFRNLPVGFIMIFYTAACSICYNDTGDNSCCVGSKAHLPLPSEEGSMPPEYLVLLDFICPNVDDMLEPLITKAPTAAPTAAPTTFPSLRPTTLSLSVSPTKSESLIELPSTSPTSVSTTPGPSTSPTAAPTVSPTVQPTKRPTQNPSLSPTIEMTETPSEKPTGAPTSSPTHAPTREPTHAPTKVPTLQPTSRPTQSPLVLATLRPSVAETSSPTKAPTLRPTASPSASPTPAPTVRPTSSPTSAPSLQPTCSPTRTPTVSPTLQPTTMPTVSPTSVPTAMPLTEAPTANPTKAPTPSPTMFPTQSPTFAPTAIPTSKPLDLLCISFAYTLQNTTGFTADDIFNEVDNTIKDRLLAATRTVAIDILNITQPRIPNPALNRNLIQTQEVRNEAFRQAIIVEFGSEQIIHAVGRREQSVLTWDENAGSGSKYMRRTGRLRKRRLAFFSDEFPVEISSILDSMFCATPNQPCVVVSTRVCVVLEAFDDPDVIRTNLIQGFRNSIDGGGFNSVIPRDTRR